VPPAPCSTVLPEELGGSVDKVTNLFTCYDGYEVTHGVTSYVDTCQDRWKRADDGRDLTPCDIPSTCQVRKKGGFKGRGGG
jgi:hypothetical protein